jgi:hypothetical protein
MSLSESIPDEEYRMSFNEQAHADYILTAEFDVDAGPIISHQYPEPLGGDVRFAFGGLSLIVVKCWRN